MDTNTAATTEHKDCTLSHDIVSSQSQHNKICDCSDANTYEHQCWLIGLFDKESDWLHLLLERCSRDMTGLIYYYCVRARHIEAYTCSSFFSCFTDAFLHFICLCLSCCLALFPFEINLFSSRSIWLHEYYKWYIKDFRGIKNWLTIPIHTQIKYYKQAFVKKNVQINWS